MKTVGIIGGIGPESTIEYYRFIIEGYRGRKNGLEHPSIIINSIDLERVIAWLNANDLDQLADYVSKEIERLAHAGADFAVIASNSSHIIFDRLRARSPIPLVSIVESTFERARSLGLKRVGLFGARFTMGTQFYRSVFSQGDVELVFPTAAEQDFIHEKYMAELLKNIFLPATRDRLLAIVDRMKKENDIDGLILGGTELPLILRRPEHNGVAFLDTTQIHVDRIVEELCSDDRVVSS